MSTSKATISWQAELVAEFVFWFGKVTYQGDSPSGGFTTRGYWDWCNHKSPLGSKDEWYFNL